jgi:hypothetical protein
MKVCLTYILPQINVRVYEPLARRFAESYVRNPPGLEPHDLTVISNGGPIQERQKRLFDPLPCRWMEHNNMGRDIGAFQLAAEKVPCDLLICFGSHIHFCRAGWLDRIVEAFLNNGPALYGAWGFHQPADHIRTTAFWVPPELLRSYPAWVGDRQRYQFEHGPQSITAHVRNLGFPTLQVTWSRVLDHLQWQHVVREDTLLLDQHTAALGWNAR